MSRESPLTGRAIAFAALDGTSGDLLGVVRLHDPWGVRQRSDGGQRQARPILTMIVIVKTASERSQPASICADRRKCFDFLIRAGWNALRKRATYSSPCR